MKLKLHTYIAAGEAWGAFGATLTTENRILSVVSSLRPLAVVRGVQKDRRVPE